MSTLRCYLTYFYCTNKEMSLKPTAAASVEKDRREARGVAGCNTHASMAKPESGGSEFCVLGVGR
jgi:hypothetical protein